MDKNSVLIKFALNIELMVQIWVFKIRRTHTQILTVDSLKKKKKPVCN